MFRAADSIYRPDFAAWPTKRSVLEGAVFHLAPCSDNNYHLCKILKFRLTWENASSYSRGFSLYLQQSSYPGCQRLFTRGFRFRSSLKKWHARKASGPERYYNLAYTKGGISYIPWCFAASFCLLSTVERAFEGFEGNFQRPEFQDAAHPRKVSMSPVNLWYLIDNVKCFLGHFTHYCSRLRPC